MADTMSRTLLQAQVRKKSTTPGNCGTHHGNKVVLVCLRKGCGGEMVCVDCVASNHRGHEMEKLETYASMKKQILKDKMKNEKHEILTTLQKKIKHTKDKITENKRKGDNSQKEIFSRCDDVKDKLDKIAENCAKMCKAKEEENEKTLIEYLEYLEDLYSSHKAEMDKCVDVVEEGSDYEIVLAEKEILPQPNPRDIPMTEVQKFIFKEISSTDLQECFGDLIVMKDGDDFGAAKTKKKDGETSSLPHLDAPKHGREIRTLKEFDIESNNDYACEFLYPASDQIYVWFYRSFTVSIITKDGNVKNTVTLQSTAGKSDYIQDLCLSSADNTLWSLNSNGKIQQVRTDNKKLKSVKNFVGKKEEPKSLCMTRKEELVVGMGNPHQIAILTTTGKVIRTIDLQKVGLENIPYCIIQCQRTGNYAIMDGIRTLSIVDENFSLQYTICRDSVTPAGGSATATGYVCQKDFRPWRMCFDCDDNLLIVDYDNYSIIMFNSSGHFIKTIVMETEDHKPCTVNIATDDTIWVAYCDEAVKNIKYK